METLLRDLRYGLRALRRDRGLAVAAVSTLALGIGVGTAIFSVVDGVLFKPLPGIREPGRLVALYSDDRATAMPEFQGIPYPDYRDYRALDDVLSGLATYVRMSFVIAGSDGHRRVVGELVSGDYFEVLGTQPALGRLLQPSDDRPGAPAAAVIGHRFWTERLASDPDVLGTTIRLDGEPLRVVGVAPPGFRGPLLDWYGRHDLDVFVPFAMIDRFLGPLREDRGFIGPMLVGRLAEGVAVLRARSALQARARRLEAEYPNTNAGRGLTVLPAQRARFWPGRWDGTTRLLGMLSAGAALLLAIVCFNLINLLLARVLARRNEIAVRLALGATQRQVVGQWLVEAAILVAGGAIAGLLVASLFLRLLAFFPEPFGVTVLQEVRLDARAFAFASAAALMACLALGLAPALSASRAPLCSTMNTGREGAGGSRIGARQLLLVAQVAVSVVILIGAGVFGRSMIGLWAIDPGFRAENVVSISIDARLVEADGADLSGLYADVLDRLRALPTVESATMGDAPLQGFPRPVRVVVAAGPSATPLVGATSRPGATSGPGVRDVATTCKRIAPGYFRTFSIPLLQGRDFAGGADDAESVIVDRTLAERLWPGADAIGRQITVDDDGEALRVIGVAGNVPFRDSWEAPEPHFYLPILRPGIGWEQSVAVRTTAPAPFFRSVGETIRAAFPRLAIVDMVSAEAQLRADLSRQRLIATLTAALGLVALSLVTVGIAGLLSFMVNQRRREIAVRIALGAARRRVGVEVVAAALRLAAAGTAVGMPLWLLLGGVAEAELYGVAPTDPVTAALVAVGIAIVTMLSAFSPARRAMATDPMRTLRDG